MAKIPGTVRDDFGNVEDLEPAEANQIGVNIEQLKKWLELTFNDHIVDGLNPVPSGEFGDMDMTIPAGTVMFDGVVLTTDASLHTYPDSSDVYVDLSKTGVFTYLPVANGAGAPAVTANSIRLFKVVTTEPIPLNPPPTDEPLISFVETLAKRTIYPQLQRAPVVMEHTTASLNSGSGELITFIHGLGTDKVRVVPMCKGSLGGGANSAGGAWALSWARPDLLRGGMIGPTGSGGANGVPDPATGRIQVYAVNQWGSAQTLTVSVAIYPEP